MRSLFVSPLSLLCLALWAPVALTAQERDRSKIPDQFKWNLTDLYSSDAVWKAAKQRFIEELSAIQKYQGTLGMSADRLLGCLDLIGHLNREFARLFTYVNLSLDQDMREQSYLALRQEIDQLGATFGEKSAFVEPEILEIDSAVLQSFLDSDRRLDPYCHNLDDILRRKVHTGTVGEERIIADAELISDAPWNIRDMFVNTDFPYPEVTLSDGEVVTLDQSGFSLHRRSANREDRSKALTAFMGKLNDFGRTFGTLLNAQIMKDLFYMKARKYNSCLESSLDGDNIPVQVYSNLIENVNLNLGTFHRYLKLRQRVLGVDELHYYDLPAPLVASADRQYTFKEAQTHLLAGFRPLGNDYIAVVKKAFADRWIDVYPTEGKRPGGYSNGWAYDVHPYIMVNYGGKYDDMSGIAHELGHAVQSYLSNDHEPFATATCPRFVVEVASTFNEALLVDYMLKQSRSDDVRLSILGNCLDGFATKIFRATLLSEFELRVHEMAEKGEQLTGDTLNSLYSEITRKYYGHDRNVCVVDDDSKAEWMLIPQLYSEFYAYQYATSYIVSEALSELVLSGDRAVKKKYLDFLSSGGSDYAIGLLKKAGVDVATSEPFELSMKKMNRLMNEMESMLDKKK